MKTPRAAAPRPGLQLDGVQVRHVVRADDVEALVAHPAGVGRLLLGGEFLRQLFRDDGVLGHALLLAVFKVVHRRASRSSSAAAHSSGRDGDAFVRLHAHDRSGRRSGVRSDGCARASSTTSPTLTWKSRYSPRKTLASTVPEQTLSPSAGGRRSSRQLHVLGPHRDARRVVGAHAASRG